MKNLTRLTIYIVCLLGIIAPPHAYGAANGEPLANAAPHAAPLAAPHAAPHASAHKGIIAAAHPLAAQAGRDILAQGGSAVDAAIAIQAVLGLVEPQSSGLAGGGFMLHYDAATQNLTSWDGRETAPANMQADALMPFTGGRQKFAQAIMSGFATGVPGIPQMFAQTHKRYGRLTWRALLTPAIKLAEQGFAITPRLHYLIDRDPLLAMDADARAYFYTAQNKAKPVGHILKNPAYAKTLRRMAKNGAADFYRTTPNSIGASILARLSKTDSPMTKGDLRTYRAKQRAPVCAPYRAYKICSMGPPTSGGITLLQILALLSAFDMSAYAPTSPTAIHLISEASRLAFADRDRYLGDSDFVNVPVKGLLDPAYLARRARAINPHSRIATVKAGRPVGSEKLSRADNRSIAQPSTTHFVVRDGAGNAVSMTSSVESAFGARYMAGGMMLNNQLTDFSFLPDDNGTPIANAVAGGKRPRSSMTPVMIFDAENRLVALLGSPGGARIIGYVAQTISALIDHKMSMQAAINLPRHIAYQGKIELEAHTPIGQNAQTKPALEALGHVVVVRALPSGLHGLERLEREKWRGGADPRREGVVLTAP